MNLVNNIFQGVLWSKKENRVVKNETIFMKACSVRRHNSKQPYDQYMNTKRERKQWIKHC